MDELLTEESHHDIAISATSDLWKIAEYLMTPAPKSPCHRANGPRLSCRGIGSGCNDLPRQALERHPRRDTRSPPPPQHPLVRAVSATTPRPFWPEFAARKRAKKPRIRLLVGVVGSPLSASADWNGLPLPLRRFSDDLLCCFTAVSPLILCVFCPSITLVTWF